MAQSADDARRWDILWLLLCGLASSLWCVTASGQLSLTADEPAYLEKGVARWRSGSYHEFMAMGTMPLPADVQTLPLYLRERWRGTPYRMDLEDLGRLLPYARAMNLVFWWLLLGYGWLTGRRLAGRWGGRLAVALLAAEPTLLAHAGLATTDIAVTACLLAFAYHFAAGRGANWLRRVGVPAVWFAALLLAKASGLLFGPLAMLVIGWMHLLRERREEGDQSSRTLLRSTFFFHLDCVQIALGGLVLALLYCGSEWHPSTALVEPMSRLPEGPFRWGLAWLIRLPIFSNAAEGLLWQVCHNHEGTVAYLLGEVRPAVWYFFPVALSIKLTLALLLLPLLPALLRPKMQLNWPFLLALALLALSLTYRVQNGVRLVLPLVGVGIVGLSVAIVDAWRGVAPGWRKRVLAVAPALAVGWATWAALAVWPDGLRYTNELWGGTERGYLCLNDSNYDWGQGLKELARWQRRRGLDTLCVWRFGNDPLVVRQRMRELQLETLPLDNPAGLETLVDGRYLAASLLWVHGYCDTPVVRHLRSRQPVARTSTYLIYDFTREKVSEKRLTSR
jgi:hypothetical protein